MDVFRDDSRVRFRHIEVADRDVARNMGIELARGELLRFLDDDDYLIPEAASGQYDAVLRLGADFSSAGISAVDQDGSHLRDLYPPVVSSGLLASLRHDRVQIPLAHVYRRSTLGHLRWPVGMAQSEDIVWLVRYVTEAERSWVRIESCVGVWFQHDGSRMSLDRPSGFVHEPTAKALLDAADRLRMDGRLDEEVVSAIGIGVWECIHRAFHFNPGTWTRVARLVRKLAPSARPTASIYKFPLDPLLMQWLLFPKRWFGNLILQIKGMLYGWDYRRTL